MTYSFVVLAMMLSTWQRLGLERDLVVGTLRATVQLLAVGYVLQLVFNLKDWPFMVLMIGVMTVVAAYNASRRGRELPAIFIKVLVAIGAAEIMALGLTLGLGIVEPTPQFVIPLSGMFIGNAMVASSLLLNSLRREIISHRAEIIVALSLGATARQAVSESLRRAVRASSIPIVDGLKTVGLVQLPGMMTGLIIGGASPIDAVRYQLLIMFALAAVMAFTSIILSFLVYPALFTPAHQLIER
ncbi:MAG: iron export ABC transporter permease subunit FetB [Peptococcaceae bacterium]|nr:iron export ABC transporter permease subunit FetB [Peptococcaceae bacterium]